jgi:hypothetical protein
VRADDGTRTHDLLHGKGQRCSRPFAPVRSNSVSAGSASEQANPSEHERTPNLAILATVSGDPARSRARVSPCVRAQATASIDDGEESSAPECGGAAPQAATSSSGQAPIRTRSHSVSGTRSAPPGQTTVRVSWSTLTPTNPSGSSASPNTGPHTFEHRTSPDTRPRRRHRDHNPKKRLIVCTSKIVPRAAVDSTAPILGDDTTRLARRRDPRRAGSGCRLSTSRMRCAARPGSRRVITPLNGDRLHFRCLCVRDREVLKLVRLPARGTLADRERLGRQPKSRFG